MKRTFALLIMMFCLTAQAGILDDAQSLENEMNAVKPDLAHMTLSQRQLVDKASAFLQKAFLASPNEAELKAIARILVRATLYDQENAVAFDNVKALRRNWPRIEKLLREFEKDKSWERQTLNIVRYNYSLALDNRR